MGEGRAPSGEGLAPSIAGVERAEEVVAEPVVLQKGRWRWRLP